MITAIVVTLISLLLLGATAVTTVYAQQFPSIPAEIDENGVFENEIDGFRVQIPDGWVAQDIDNLNPANFRASFDTGIIIMAKICPEGEALPGIGGVHNCEQALGDSVQITRHTHLEDRPQFAVIEDPLMITPDDFLAFLIGDFQSRGYTNIDLVNSTDLTVNLTNANNPPRALPAKFVEITYQPNIGLPALRMYAILVTVPENLNPGTDQTVSGDSIMYESLAETTPTGNPPAPMQQLFDSFELVR